MDESQKWTVACLRNKVIDLEATEEHRECASDLQEALDLIEQQAARIAELERQLKDAAMSTHRQAICIQQCAAAIGPETSATINGLPNAVKALAEHNAALEAQIAAAEKQEPVAVIGSVFQLLYCRENWSEGLKVGMNLYATPLQSEGLRKDAGPGKQALTDAELTALVRKVEDKLGIVWFVPDDSDTYLWRTTNTNERDRFARALEQAIKEAK
jgi:hypothetical protein